MITAVALPEGSRVPRVLVKGAMFARPIVKSVLEAADEAVVLEKTYGETGVRGRGRLEEPMRAWPRR